MVDRESPSNRAALSSIGFYDSVEDALDLVAERDLADLQEILEPTKGRWLGLLEGHHFHDFNDGTTSDTRLAQFLGAPFLGTSAYVGMHFISSPADALDRSGKKTGRKTHNHSARIALWCHHGRGGGQLLSTPLNKLEHVVKAFDADMYLMGHHHKVLTGWMPHISPQWGTKGLRGIKNRDRLLATTGSFLRGYMVGNKRGGRARGSYVEQGMMTPVTLGSLVIKLRPVYQEHGPATVRISVESGQYD